MRKYDEWTQEIEHLAIAHGISIETATHMIIRKYQLNLKEIGFLYKTLVLYGLMEE